MASFKLKSNRIHQRGMYSTPNSNIQQLRSSSERTVSLDSCVTVAVQSTEAQLAVTHAHHPHVFRVVIVVRIEEIAVDSFALWAWIVGNSPTPIANINDAILIIPFSTVNGIGVFQMVRMMLHRSHVAVLFKEGNPMCS